MTHELFKPNLPLGSVYFAQMHALRWPDRTTEHCLQLLYEEILGHALFYRTLVITDSHAIQNWWLMQLLDYPNRFPGIQEFLEKGILKIVKREGKSLEQIAQNQLRKVPVIIEGRYAKLDSTFVKHAKRLDTLTKESSAEFQLTVMDLQSRVVRDVLLDPIVRTAYRIPEPVLKDLLKEIERMVRNNDQGILNARELFDLPEKKPRTFSKLANEIRWLATSVHSLNFPLSYGIPPVISPAAYDHEGAMALVSKFMPRADLTEPPDDLFTPFRNPEYSASALTKFLLTYKDILALRETEEFAALQSSLATLLNVVRISDSPNNQIHQQREAAYWDIANYLARISEHLILGGTDPGTTSSEWIRSKAHQIKAAVEKIEKDFETFYKDLEVAQYILLALSTTLCFFGVIPTVALLILSIPLPVVYQLRRKEFQEQQRELNNRLSILANTSRLVNIVTPAAVLK